MQSRVAPVLPQVSFTVQACTEQSSCTCSTYAQLWDKFLADYLEGGFSAPTKAQLPAALDDWGQWGINQDGLIDRQQDLCWGPILSVQQYDRASIGEAWFVASRAESAKFAWDSLVQRHSNGQYHAGRVRAFLSHKAPGWVDCSVEDKANIAEVGWFAPAEPGHGIADGLATDLNCPVFKREFEKDTTGNLWPLERLAFCKLLSLPHESHVDNLVVLSRFASF